MEELQVGPANKKYLKGYYNQTKTDFQLSRAKSPQIHNLRMFNMEKFKIIIIIIFSM